MTRWCISCASRGQHTAATQLVEEDPLCDPCAGREIKALGVASVQRLPAHAAPLAPVAPPKPAAADSRREHKPRKPKQPREPKAPSRPRIPEHVRQAVIEADPAVSNIALARQFGISDMSVWKIRRDAGIQPSRQRGVKISPEIRSQILEASSSASQREIARRFGVGNSSVAGILKPPTQNPSAQEANMSVPSKSARGARLPDEVRAAIRDASPDVSHATLARQYGISDVSVRSIRMGETARPQKQAITKAQPPAAHPESGVYIQLTEKLAAQIFASFTPQQKAAAITAGCRAEGQ
jgi:transposase-like protein